MVIPQCVYDRLSHSTTPLNINLFNPTATLIAVRANIQNKFQTLFVCNSYAEPITPVGFRPGSATPWRRDFNVIYFRGHRQSHKFPEVKRSEGGAPKKNKDSRPPNCFFSEYFAAPVQKQNEQEGKIQQHLDGIPNQATIHFGFLSRYSFC